MIGVQCSRLLSSKSADCVSTDAAKSEAKSLEHPIRSNATNRFYCWGFVTEQETAVGYLVHGGNWEASL